MTLQPARGPLTGLRIVESTAFIAAPLATMSLTQLGAEVIRLDPAEGGLDYRRWPLAPSGASLYWTMLNRGKRSVTLDLRTPGGRQTAADMICDSDSGGGIFVTNLPTRDVLAPQALLERRPDAIVVTLDGSPDGISAIDYTVHAASGAAMMTGPEGHVGPVNNAVPFWDVIAGRTLAMGILAAELYRLRTGRGQHIALSLSDIAMETMANLGILAETEVTGAARARHGNWIYGSFGRDFATRCGRWFMVVAVTRKQWRALVTATGLEREMAALSDAHQADLDDEHTRSHLQDQIGAYLQTWAAGLDLSQIAACFEGTPVCWSPYRDTLQMLAEDTRASPANPMFVRQSHPGVQDVLTPRSPLRFSNHPDLAPGQAPTLDTAPKRNGT
ncbi:MULTISPECIES: CoA transferase [Marivita]|uniref:CoA transferase n=1 Tax=Marivita cryptomonadis TaxID=505252 RepID=A0A9Q2S3U5_9RHOB|nr:MULTISPECIES: CoA transferase [Marivita]MCR9168346.1 CoA transferase [Paracoccaceae bacterium]MBM2323681.1 CoA transferase [Marivita cryptomonadis]MBM2333269.1 CoA transferase [Marivita cryptomonadis]MBM2342847.1 CoA transferase [Marivita cryptomonadis]MBM2347517.1 CoA transferase [Marivita cryptomonadis]